jgi:hypothetical protein
MGAFDTIEYAFIIFNSYQSEHLISILLIVVSRYGLI